MRLSRSSIAGALLLVLLSLAWSPISLRASNPGTLPSNLEYQLLSNPGMEVFDPAYAQFQGTSCQVTTDWQRFSYDGPEPCLMDTRVFASSHLGGGWVERIEGNTSQMIVSAEPYTAGIWQRVVGLVPGVGYGFHAAMLTIFQTSAPPAVDGMMIKQVGIDPYGGTDPRGQTVVWSEPNDHDEGPWDVDQRVAFYAQGSMATVFVRVISPHEAGPAPYLNLSFLDSAILAQTAEVSAISPTESDSTTFEVRWDNGVLSPDATKIRWYDVQWLDEVEGVWHDWFTLTQGTQAAFTGQIHHAYRFRARAWQKYPNGAHLYSPFRPGGDTRTYVRGPELVGRVVSNEGYHVGGATVSISGTGYQAMTDAGGYYRIPVMPTTQTYTVMVDHPVWLPPAEVHGVTFGSRETVTVNWMLRPPDDAVANGGFESELDGWSVVAGAEWVPEVVAAPIHTGQRSLALEGQAGTGTTAGVAQTVSLNRAWEPALSFWYWPQSTDHDDVFNVVMTATQPAKVDAMEEGALAVAQPLTVTTTRVLTPSLEGTAWQHLALYPGPGESYFTGTVTIRFQVWNDGDATATTVYVDEVSLGRTPGGPFRFYLPLILGGD